MVTQTFQGATQQDPLLRRITLFLYGLGAYAIFFLTFLYAIGFIGNLVVPKSIDAPPQMSFIYALLIDVGLLGLFAIQHSVMARQGFKQWWTRIIPKAIERSTYVLFSSLALILLFWQWQPLGGTLWATHHAIAQGILYTLFASGWLLVLVTTFLINHFDLFGLRQVYLYLRGQEYTPLRFVTPGPYQHVRHPLYVGWLLAFWATPTMTVAHFVFAVVTTIYILIAIQFEERDLLQVHGTTYANYRRQVPMLIPFVRRK